MVVYVHEMTMGNAHLIDKIAEQLLEDKIVEMSIRGGIQVNPSDPTELEAVLNKLDLTPNAVFPLPSFPFGVLCDPPESIVSIAFSHFD